MNREIGEVPYPEKPKKAKGKHRKKRQAKRLRVKLDGTELDQIAKQRRKRNG